jgi:hypothetical protein
MAKRPPFSATLREAPAVTTDDRNIWVAAGVADRLTRLHLRIRARVLARLLASVGSLALAVVSGGAFAKYLTTATVGVTVSLEDAARATWSQIFDLLRYVQQSNPRLFERLRDEIARLASGGESPAY